MQRHCSLAFACALFAFGASSTSATAQTPDLGWSYTAELTAVWTGGNSESKTFGAGSGLSWLGKNNGIELDAGAIKADASLEERRAVGTAEAHRIVEEKTEQTTAESFFARARYDRRIEDGLMGFAGVDWMRNTFAGIDGRLLLAGGLGYLWTETETFRFKTDLAGTYSFQEDVVDNPFVESSFPGVRFSGELMRQLSSTTKWESTFIADLNLDDTEDRRGDLTNSLSLSISSRLALKPSLELLWRNRPSLVRVDLFTEDGLPTDEEIAVPLEKVDSLFTLAIVVTL